MKTPPIQVKVLAAAKAPLAPAAIPVPPLVQAATQISGNGGGGEGPGDPPGGGDFAGSKNRAHLHKSSPIRTREQFVKNLLDRKFPEHIVQGLTRGVVDELMIRGDALGERFGEEETVQAAVRTIGRYRPSALLPGTAEKYRRQAGYRIMLKRAHERFANTTGYDKTSVNLWFVKSKFFDKELPALEDVEREVGTLLEARDQIIKYLSQVTHPDYHPNFESLLRNEVIPLVEEGFSEILVLRALRRIWDQGTGLHMYDNGRTIRLSSTDHELLRYRVMREAVIKRLSRGRRYSRRRLERWFTRQREKNHLEVMLSEELNQDDLIAEIQRSLGRRRR